MFRITIHIRKKYCKPILGRYKFLLSNKKDTALFALCLFNYRTDLVETKFSKTINSLR